MDILGLGYIPLIVVQTLLEEVAKTEHALRRITPKYLVPDTNCFVDMLDSIKKLISTTQFVVAVPLVGEFKGQILYSNALTIPLKGLPCQRIFLKVLLVRDLSEYIYTVLNNTINESSPQGLSTFGTVSSVWNLK